MKNFHMVSYCALIIALVLLAGVRCDCDKSTQPEVKAGSKLFPVTAGSWWRYHETQRIRYLNRHDSSIVIDTIAWEVFSNSSGDPFLQISTIQNGSKTVDTVGLFVGDSAIYAVGYASLAGTTTLLKASAADDTTVLVPDGIRLTHWSRNSVTYSVRSDTTLYWHGEPINGKIISAKRDNRLVSLLSMGDIGFIGKEYLPDTVIAGNDTSIAVSSIQLDTFQIK
jgi:hypothetical protein